jgi:hypothetical protein
MKQESLNRSLTAAYIIAGLLPFIYAVSRYLGKDLWWDEILSLTFSSLAGFTATATNFSQANNHVFFNLLNVALFRVLGIRTIGDALDHVTVLRSLQMTFGIFTCIYVYLFARRFIGRSGANLSLVFLSTTIPFLNFAFQLRGYSLSILLFSALLYHSFRCSAKISIRHGTLTALAAFLLLYTIPSNIYYVIALVAVLAAECLALRLAKAQATEGSPGKAILIALGFIGLGCLFALCAYLPMTGQILACRYVQKAAATRFFALTHMLPAVSSMLLSGRSILPALAIGGIVPAAIRMAKRKPVDEQVLVFVRLVLIFLIPFIVTFIRNDMPPDRVFVVPAPVFALVFASGISLLIESFPRYPAARHIFTAAIALYCLAACGWELHDIQRQLDSDIVTGSHHQDLLRNNFQSIRWNPARDLLPLAEAYRRDPAPVLVMDDQDRIAVSCYIDRLNIYDYYSLSAMRNTVSGRQGYVASHGGRNIGSFEVQVPDRFRDDAPGLFVRLFVVLNSLNFLPGGSSCYVVTGSPERLKALLNNLSGDFHPVMLNTVPACINVFKISVPEKAIFPQ